MNAFESHRHQFELENTENAHLDSTKWPATLNPKENKEYICGVAEMKGCIGVGVIRTLNGDL